MSLYYMAPHISANRLAYELGYSYMDIFYYFDSYDKKGKSYPFYPKNIDIKYNNMPTSPAIEKDIYNLLCDWHLEYEDVIFIDF